MRVTLDDIALANRLAPELLGRSLDELPPQTRRLLIQIKAAVRERMKGRQVEQTRRPVQPPRVAALERLERVPGRACT